MCARRHKARRDKPSDDGVNETEDEASEGLCLQGLEGLSSEELGKLKGAMDILNQLTPDGISALSSRPLQTVKKAEEVDHDDEVSRLSSLIDRHLAPLFDRKTSEIYRRSEDIYDEHQEFWSKLFSCTSAPRGLRSCRVSLSTITPVRWICARSSPTRS